MTLVGVLVVLAVIGVVAAVVTGAVRGDLDEPTSSLAPSGLPEGELSAEDVRAVRFSLGFRGYRMDEVDEVLERLTIELAQRDAELAALRTGSSDRAAAPEIPGGAAGGNGTAEVAPAGRHVAEGVVADRPGTAHHLPGRHEGEPRTDERTPQPADEGARGAQHRPTGATAARVGPTSGAAGWSGPEGG